MSVFADTLWHLHDGRSDQNWPSANIRHDDHSYRESVRNTHTIDGWELWPFWIKNRNCYFLKIAALVVLLSDAFSRDVDPIQPIDTAGTMLLHCPTYLELGVGDLLELITLKVRCKASCSFDGCESSPNEKAAASKEGGGVLKVTRMCTVSSGWKTTLASCAATVTALLKTAG
jgi:hypothetical protein